MPLEITFGGVTDSSAGWARRLGISRQAMQYRLDRWPSDVAIMMGGRGNGWRGDRICHDQEKGTMEMVAHACEAKVDGLSEILHERSDEVLPGLFSASERERIAEIKANRAAQANQPAPFGLC